MFRLSIQLNDQFYRRTAAVAWRLNLRWLVRAFLFARIPMLNIDLDNRKRCLGASFRLAAACGTRMATSVVRRTTAVVDGRTIRAKNEYGRSPYLIQQRRSFRAP